MGVLSLGVVIVPMAGSFTAKVTALLFGDVLGVTTSDVRSQLIATAIVAITTIVLYRPFLAFTFNRDKGQTLGMRPRLAHTVLLALPALSIVASSRRLARCWSSPAWSARRQLRR